MKARVNEIADGIYRINTPLPAGHDTPPAGFSFNQYLIVDDQPLLFHTGLRRMFPITREAVARVIPVDSLAFVSFGHVEADECGALNDWLAAAPRALPVCGALAAMVSVGDLADRPPRSLRDGETLLLGRHEVRWHDTPHLPHGWEAGLLMEETTRTLLCGDLFTQPGPGDEPVVESDILDLSESARAMFDYFAHGPTTRPLLEKLAAQAPTTLACMHGSAWWGDGAKLLRALADRVA